MTPTSVLPSARSKTGLAARCRRGRLGGTVLAVPASLLAASAQTGAAVSPSNGGPSDVVSAW